MSISVSTTKLDQLSKALEGEFYYDSTMRTLYATDASAYRDFPLAVAMPRHKEDLKQLIQFANENQTSLIPRTAGTSLAGQVVGKGIIVDVSKYFTQILEVNKEEGWVRLEPGVVRDELNMHLKDFGWYYGPETSTANRAMIGGMVGNNSCGSNSVVYGSSRDHLVEVKALLSDGSEVEFKSLTKKEFEAKLNSPNTLEAEIYQKTYELLADAGIRTEIEKEYPKKSIPRRNTGYALDLLMDANVFEENAPDFNFCKLIAGSEGTLCFITEIKTKLVPLPPKYKVLHCAHFDTIDASLKATLLSLNYNPSAVELMDKYILDCTKENIAQKENRFFVNGDPGAILVTELTGNTEEEAINKASLLTEDMKKANLGYEYPLVKGSDIKKVWTLRKAGLGLLSNIPGDAKPAPVIEDTAVAVEDLPAFIADFNVVLERYNLYCVHYAHAGSGELHLRPIINLKTEEGNKLFKDIATEIAILVKKYKGSLSGEHGDGRLRGEFIPYMIGDKNYQTLKVVKDAWDPNQIFNPNKIVDTPSMNSSLRYAPGQDTPSFNTYYRWEESEGVLRAAEKCNGSADCRKTELSGGTMCPSYMATRNEKETTRARANMLREVLTNNKTDNPFADEGLKDVMDLCLSCKGCKSECPSNVDLARLKGEFQQQYYDKNGVPFRTQMIAHSGKINKIASVLPSVYNAFAKSKITAPIIKNTLGFAQERPIPLLGRTTVGKWWRKLNPKLSGSPKGKLVLLVDEFTNFLDVEVGQDTLLLLSSLGYSIEVVDHLDSGRTYLSKGVLKAAKTLADKNVRFLEGKVSEAVPLVGIEPSSILSFRDEYLDLVDQSLLDSAKKIAENTLTIEEFISREIDKGNILSEQFESESKEIKMHGHCHQKSLSSVSHTKKILSMPKNYKVLNIPSGCCGMAGSFGYEKEHYEISMKIGELVLFPAVRSAKETTLIAAAGTSCRHQIMDGTKRKALHPVQILWKAFSK